MNTRDVTTRYANCARAQTGRRPPCLLRVPLAPRNRFVTCSQRDKVNAEASFICYRFSRFKCFISLYLLVFNFYFFVFLYFNFYFFIDAGIFISDEICILCVCYLCTTLHSDLYIHVHNYCSNFDIFNCPNFVDNL